MNNFKNYLKSCFTVKSALICTSCLVAAILTMSLVLTAIAKDVQINDDGAVLNTKIYSRTVQGALKEAGIALRTGDEMSCSPEDLVKENPVISIQRAAAVNLSYHGKEEVVYTTKDTVKEFIEEKQIPIGDENLLIGSLEEPITENMTVTVIPKIYKEVVETEDIEFGIIKKASYNLEQGATRVVSEGETGVKENVYKVLEHDGQILEKVKVAENVVKEPVSKIVEYGTIAVMKTSRGDTFRYKKVIDVRATAYDNSFASNGKNPGDPYYGITASGMKARRGVIAVDPKVIPLGTRLYVAAADGSWTYGYCIAGDTGGAIKGNKIDLFFDTAAEVRKFGVRNARVYILE